MCWALERVKLLQSYSSADPFNHLYGLQLPDRSSERSAFVCVVRSTVQRSLSNTESLGRDADPAAVQGLLCDREDEC